MGMNKLPWILFLGGFAMTAEAKPLVAYFSATGTTERLAKTAAKAMDADLFEIVPAQKYTDADLDWNDRKSRSTIECDNPAARPAIRGKADIARYDSIVVAFPIWWYNAPKIIYTFMESANFDGKKIVLICTSGGSGLGRTADDLKKVTSPKADIRNGKRFSGNASESELREFLQKAFR